MKKKRQQLLGALAILSLLLGACHTAINDNDGQCHIYGTINPRFEGKKIFLVPQQGPAVAETVDSVIIQNGRFAFHVAPGEMKVIRIDYHFRTGVEDLLVVAEPGRIEVTIDSVSHGGGTPQNDSLQQWKEYTAAHTRRVIPYRMKLREAVKQGSQAEKEALTHTIDSMQREYRRHSRQLAKQLNEGILHDFLTRQFPSTIKRRMPDGTVEEVPYD